ncbi:MAG: toprim domain-containing protein, partial [Candidatus Nanohaloarchaea archaeon]
RDYIIKRAKQLLSDIERDSPNKKQITEQLKKEMRKDEVTEYQGFPAGPEAEYRNEIIIVEGKSDVENLVANGVKNCLGIGGTSIPRKIVEITQQKETTVFIDGDRGGKLILKEMKQKAKPEYIAKAPEGKEVEELTKKQIHKALRDKEPIKYDKTDTENVEKNQLDKDEKEKISEELENLVGTRAVYGLNKEMEEEIQKPLNSFKEAVENEKTRYIVFDGEIDNEKIELAEENNLKVLAGMKKSEKASSSKTRILTKDELKKEAVN